MLPIEVSLTVPAASATGIKTAGTFGPGAATLNGAYVTNGVAVMPSGVARPVLLTFAGDETGHTFTITGTSRGGQAQSEIVAGTTAGTVATGNDFLTVTSVVSSALTTGNVSVGTNGVASTRWVYVSDHMTPVNLSIATDVIGTVSYTAEVCYKDPAGHPYDFTAQGPLNVPVYPDPTMAAKTGNFVTVINDPITAWRITMNSGSGTVNAIGIQAGIAGN